MGWSKTLDDIALLKPSADCVSVFPRASGRSRIREVTNESTPANGDRFKFNAREFDQPVELNYVRARYADAKIGRFISPDPLSYDAADSNPYRGIGNSPT